MAYIGKSPTAAPLTSSDVADGIITNAKLAQDIISGDTALGAEPADTDEFLVSDAGTLKRMDYSHIKGGGKIGQIVTASKTDTFTLTADSTATDITGLSVAITPTATSSKVLCQFCVYTSQGIFGHTGPAIFLIRGSTHISLGDASSSRTRSTTSPSHQEDDAHAFGQHNCIFLDSPNTTSATTYKLQIYSATGGDTTHYVNRGTTDSDNSYALRTASNLVLMEVLA